MERLKYSLALRCLEDTRSPKPLLFLLRDYRKSHAVEGLVRKTLWREFQQNIPIEVFWNLLADWTIRFAS